MGRLFGTDGVRGLANGDLTPELALRRRRRRRRTCSPSAVRPGTAPPWPSVGRDPRASGEMLEAAVVAGLASAGADVLRVGVLPTPAVAFLTAELGADFGVMLSASHNPMPDNGIKFFAARRAQAADEVEDADRGRGSARPGPRPDRRRRRPGRTTCPTAPTTTPTTWSARCRTGWTG